MRVWHIEIYLLLLYIVRTHCEQGTEQKLTQQLKCFNFKWLILNTKGERSLAYIVCSQRTTKKNTLTKHQYAMQQKPSTEHHSFDLRHVIWGLWHESSSSSLCLLFYNMKNSIGWMDEWMHWLKNVNGFSLWKSEDWKFIAFSFQFVFFSFSRSLERKSLEQMHIWLPEAF